MTQNEQIKMALEQGKRITSLDALNDFRCLRLASRIADLRKMGMPIVTRNRTENGKTFAEYFLKKEEN